LLVFLPTFDYVRNFANTGIGMPPSDESARNQTGPPEQAAGTGRDQQEGDLTETPESLPSRVHDLIDRWLVRRRRGLRPQDIGDLLGIVHYLAATLALRGQGGCPRGKHGGSKVLQYHHI